MIFHIIDLLVLMAAVFSYLINYKRVIINFLSGKSIPTKTVFVSSLNHPALMIFSSAILSRLLVVEESSIILKDLYSKECDLCKIYSDQEIEQYVSTD